MGESKGKGKQAQDQTGIRGEGRIMSGVRDGVILGSVSETVLDRGQRLETGSSKRSGRGSQCDQRASTRSDRSSR